MAITPRCEKTGTGSSTGLPVALTSWTNAGLGASGTAPATGDIVLIVGGALTTSAAVTQTAGTGTWTIHSSDNNGGGNNYTTFAAFRVFDGTETAPTFGWSGTHRYAFAVIALAPDANSVPSVDVWATTKIDPTLATSHTANAASDTSAFTDLSLILAGGVAGATGTSAITFTAPAGWAIPSGGSVSNTGATGQNGLGAVLCYQQSLTGTVTPGSQTIEGGSAAAGTTGANLYHVLIKENATTAKTLAATAATTGTLTRAAGNVLAGTVTATGTLARSASRLLSATTATAGALTRVTGKTLAVTTSTTGTLNRGPVRTLAAMVSATGSLTRSAGRALAATVTTSGTFSSADVFHRTLTATVTSAAALQRTVSRTLQATVTATGGGATGRARDAVVTLGNLMLRWASAASGGRWGAGAGPGRWETPSGPGRWGMRGDGNDHWEAGQ